MQRALDHLLGSQEAFAQLLQAHGSSDSTAAGELWGLVLPLLQQVLRALLKQASQDAKKRQLKAAYMLTLRTEQADPAQVLALVMVKLQPP